MPNMHSVAACRMFSSHQLSWLGFVVVWRVCERQATEFVWERNSQVRLCKENSKVLKRSKIHTIYSLGESTG